MFSRRHPYLYFLLTLSSIASISFIVISLIVLIGVKSTARLDILDAKDKVGVVEIKGFIGDPIETIKDIKEYREDSTIKAIVLRIDSPGGGVGASQEIYREVQRTLSEKTVVASLGAVAASGGYYVAAGAKGIIANSGTLTGSIGVVMGFTDIQELLQKIGVTPFVIKSGEFKDMGSPLRTMTNSEKNILQNFSDQVHKQFIAAIAEGRGLEYEKVAAIADGRLISGENAQQLGLVDRLGNIEDAIEWAGQLGGISGKPTVVYSTDKRTTFIRRITETAVQEIIKSLSALRLFVGYVMQ